MFALSYVTKAAFDGIREWLGRRNQAISDLKAHYAVLEKDQGERFDDFFPGERASSLEREEHTAC